MNFRNLLLVLVFIVLSSISNHSFSQIDSSESITNQDQQVLEDISLEEDKVRTESQNNMDRQSAADASEKEYATKAKETQRLKNEADIAARHARKVNNEATNAAKQAKRAAKLERKAQKAREKADAQRIKANEAANKSDNN